MKIPASGLECVPITMYLCSAITVHSCCDATWYAMQFISYTESDQQTEQVGTFIRTMDATPSHLSFQGAEGNEGFQMFIKAIQRGDTVVFLSMKGIFSSVETFLMFLRFCQNEEVRLISIQDEIDTADVIFPLPCSSRWMKILCSLQSTKRTEHDDAQAEMLAETAHERMVKRHCMVMNLYQSGAKIEEVMRLTGYKSTRSIYTILHDNGVDLQFPSMKRERKREENPQ